MSGKGFVAAVLAISTFVVPPLSAQPAAEELQEATQEYEVWIEAMSDHIGSVRFDEGDVKSYLRYWNEFSQLDEDAGEEEDWEQVKDLDWVLENPAYRSWTSQHGLDAEDWLLKSLRITVMVMREQMQQNYAMIQQQRPEQMAMIEEQCKQVGPEICKQMKDAMAASLAVTEGMGRAWEKIPEPTAAEAGLLQQYQGEIMALMEGDEDEEDDW